MTTDQQRLPGIVVIPARSGSQRVPGKNIRAVNGIPALARVIALCQEADIADRIIVSTDSKDIADVALGAGADVPFQRPNELSDAHTGIIQVIQHTLRELALPADTAVACVYATAFTLDPRDLAAGRHQLDQSPGDSFIVSVTPFDYPIQRALEMNSQGHLSMIEAGHAATRSQDLPERWHDAGQFIWGTAETWLSASSVWDHAQGQPVAHWRSIDIDTEEDWEHAELVLQAIESLARDR